jgi:hypothetical protein
MDWFKWDRESTQISHMVQRLHAALVISVNATSASKPRLDPHRICALDRPHKRARSPAERRQGAPDPYGALAVPAGAHAAHIDQLAPITPRKAQLREAALWREADHHEALALETLDLQPALCPP